MAQTSQAFSDLAVLSGASKSDQVIYQVYEKLCLLVYQARSTVQDIGSGRINKWFNLQTPDVSLFRQSTRLYRHVSQSRPEQPFQLKVLLVAPTLSTHEVLVYEGHPHSTLPFALDSFPAHLLLETWTINGSATFASPDDEYSPNTYKEGISLFRNIFTLLRTMPSWRLDRRLGKLSRGTANRKFSVIVQIAELDDTAHRSTAHLPHKSHFFPSLRHIGGDVCVSVQWLADPHFRVMDRASYESSQFEVFPSVYPTALERSISLSSGSLMRRRLLLNDLLQSSYGIHALNIMNSGPSPDGLWEVIVYVNDIEYGRGKDSSADLAAEFAAGEAYDQLRELIQQEDPLQGYTDPQRSRISPHRSVHTFQGVSSMRPGAQQLTRPATAVSAPPSTMSDNLSTSTRRRFETRSRQRSSPLSSPACSLARVGGIVGSALGFGPGPSVDEDWQVFNPDMSHFESPTDPMIVLMLKHVLSERVSQDAVLTLTDDNAQFALDAMQDLLDDGPSQSLNITMNDASLDLPHRLRRLLLKLVLKCDKLPRALFLSDVRIASTDNYGGFGGFSDIFDGKYGTQRVAVKRLRVFQFMEPSKRGAVRQAFYHEAITWRTLVHRHILRFIGIDDKLFPPSLCMVSPWMEHGPIRHTMDNLKTLDGISTDALFEYVQRWIREIALGLAYLHGENVVHGDLRCANILIDVDMEVRLADFGLSVFADGASNHYASVRAGATKWLAPEVIDPEEFGMQSSRPTFMSDIYSYACVLTELYTGSAPFADLSEHTVILRIMQGTRPTRPLFHGGEIMSDDLWDLSCRCWSHSPSNRPTASAVVETLSTMESHGHAI